MLSKYKDHKSNLMHKIDAHIKLKDVLWTIIRDAWYYIRAHG